MHQRTVLFDILNSYFDKIYIITLKRSSNRHAAFQKTLKELNYEIFWGVDGNNLSLPDLEESGLYSSEAVKSVKRQKKCPPADLTHGMIGCTLSHLSLYKQMIERGEDRVLILEDDIRIEDYKAADLDKAIEQLPDNWELFYLGYLYNNNSLTFSAKLRIKFAYPLLSLLGFSQYNAKRYRCKYPRNYSTHLNLSGYHYGAHAYGITKEGARKILEHQTPISMEIDNAIGEMCMREEIAAYSMKERIIHQNREMFDSMTAS
jgi:GR25 family glycosyltransferase involved in LPS biosynthesis